MSNYDIVCIGPHSWSKGIDGQIWRRRHHLMINLAKKHRVLFIEKAYFSPFRFLGSVFRIPAAVSPVQKVCANLWTLTLYNPLPFEETALRKGVEIIRRINDKVCLYQIKKALKDLDFESNFLLWAYYTPRTAYLLKKLQAKFTVCDVYDKYTEYATVDSWQKEHITDQEKIIFKNSNIVFSVSQPLLDYCQKYNSDCHVIPNGVGEIFYAVDAHAVDVPHDLNSIPAPRLGYVGSIFDKLDYELLLTVIKSCEKCSFVFIGPVRILDNRKRLQYDELTKLSNAFFLGPKSMKELPGYYKGFDVCIAPFDTSLPLIKSIDIGSHCKMWEYLATGKPTIVTQSSNDTRMQRVISVAKNADDFIKAIGHALEKNCASHKELRITLAQEGAWPKRVAEMEKIIAQHMKEQKMLISSP